MDAYKLFHWLRKVVFLVIDLTWKIFSQTGNIEAYLLLKELEDEPQASEHHSPANSEAATQDTNL